MMFLSFFLFLCVVNAEDWYRNHWCGGDLEYLDDGKCIKKFPSKYEREAWSCPTYVYNSPPEGFQKETTLNKLEVNVETLKELLSTDANICVIPIKRVNENGKQVMYNKYFCSGSESVQVPYEPWSSSKIFAMANAAGHLRTNESSCSQEGVLGLDGQTTGKHGATELGDLSTIVCSYDTTAGYSSNSLSSYFHDLGWRDRIHDLVINWLGAEKESLGGNYGEATPSDLGFTLTSESGESKCAVDKDPWPTVYPNSLSALSEAELTRRLVLHDEIDESLRFPGLATEDVKNIKYGAEESVLFEGLKWGGMTSDISVFLQSSINIDEIETRSQGNWRIFSKLGAGFSTSRYRGEIVNNIYACFPNLDADGNAIENDSWEFVITVRGSVPDDYSLKKVENVVLTSVQEAVAALFDGHLN